MRRSLLAALVGALVASGSAGPASAAILITEVAPWGSGGTPYVADWFELTNSGAAAVDITGWKIDDSSGLAASAAALRGVTSIPAGAAAIFFEGADDGSTDATIAANFLSAWFPGGAPSGFLIGSYGGSGLGLSTSGDAVNIFNAADALVAKVTFGASTPNVTFDNSAGLNNATISTLSAVGVNGAFSASGAVGSPGQAVPEPAAILLIGLGALGLMRARRNV
jgi:hypothetical protein